MSNHIEANVLKGEYVPTDGTAVREVSYAAPLRVNLIGISSAFCKETFTSALTPDEFFLVDVHQTMPKVNAFRAQSVSVIVKPFTINLTFRLF